MSLEEVVRDMKAYENALRIARNMKWDSTAAELKAVVRALAITERKIRKRQCIGAVGNNA